MPIEPPIPVTTTNVARYCPTYSEDKLIPHGESLMTCNRLPWAVQRCYASCDDASTSEHIWELGISNSFRVVEESWFRYLRHTPNSSYWKKRAFPRFIISLILCPADPLECFLRGWWRLASTENIQGNALHFLTDCPSGVGMCPAAPCPQHLPRSAHPADRRL